MKTNRWCASVAVVVVGVGIAATTRANDTYGPEGKRFGPGIILGEPTGVTFKGYVAPRVAFGLGGSWSFVDDAVTVTGDVTFDVAELPVQSGTVDVPFYVGAGGKFGFDRRGKNSGRTIAGVRVPVGLAIQWSQHPVELFFEVAPGIEVAPATAVDITGGLGVRFYF